MSYKTLKVSFQETICTIQLYRPEAQNTINSTMIEECNQVLDLCKENTTIVVLEGLPEVFCFGADFKGIHGKITEEKDIDRDPGPLYDLWVKLATSPYIVISHVRGKVNAGGVGFIAASDVVIAEETAKFSLSELLFGLLPACVMPFLIRRIGFQKANYLTLITHPISADEALNWGLVDAVGSQSEILLRKHLLRLKCLAKTGILRHKRYMNGLYDMLLQSRSLALSTNREVFSDPDNINNIVRYVETGMFPWEGR